jgi:acetyl-CoA C-acetyltransferase
MQAFEVATHIWNRWSEIHGDEARWRAFRREKPADWTDLQVKGARRGMAISHAGVGSHVTATVLMDPDHLLEQGK